MLIYDHSGCLFSAVVKKPLPLSLGGNHGDVLKARDILQLLGKERTRDIGAPTCHRCWRGWFKIVCLVFIHQISINVVLDKEARGIKPRKEKGQLQGPQAVAVVLFTHQ